jgi:hypothetical protein
MVDTLKVTHVHIRRAIWRARQDMALIDKPSRLLGDLKDQPKTVQEDVETEVRAVMHAIRFPEAYR